MIDDTVPAGVFADCTPYQQVVVIGCASRSGMSATTS